MAAGASSVFCIFQPEQAPLNESDSFISNDMKAIESDWKTVGNDLIYSMEYYNGVEQK